jgi:hypothetical protein
MEPCGSATGTLEPTLSIFWLCWWKGHTRFDRPASSVLSHKSRFGLGCTLLTARTIRMTLSSVFAVRRAVLLVFMSSSRLALRPTKGVNRCCLLHEMKCSAAPKGLMHDAVRLNEQVDARMAETLTISCPVIVVLRTNHAPWVMLLLVLLFILRT